MAQSIETGVTRDGQFPLDTRRMIAPNGAKVHTGLARMHIEASGTAVVAASIRESARGPVREVAPFLVELLKVASEIADEIEPWL
jgi:hypothetical protein